MRRDDHMVITNIERCCRYAMSCANRTKENAIQLLTLYVPSPYLPRVVELRPVVKTGGGSRHDLNPLNTWQSQLPPKPGEQIVSMQNWRPGEKMLGPHGVHG